MHDKNKIKFGIHYYAESNQRLQKHAEIIITTVVIVIPKNYVLPLLKVYGNCLLCINETGKHQNKRIKVF